MRHTVVTNNVNTPLPIIFYCIAGVSGGSNIAELWSRRAARRGQGGRLTTLNFRPGAVTTLNLGHVSIFFIK